MKSRFLIYILPVLLVMALVYGYSTQNDPRLDAAPQSTTSGQQSADVSKLILTSETDTLVPAGFPVTLWNYIFQQIQAVKAQDLLVLHISAENTLTTDGILQHFTD